MVEGDLSFDECDRGKSRIRCSDEARRGHIATKHLISFLSAGRLDPRRLNEQVNPRRDITEDWSKPAQ